VHFDDDGASNLDKNAWSTHEPVVQRKTQEKTVLVKNKYDGEGRCNLNSVKLEKKEYETTRNQFFFKCGKWNVQERDL